MKKKPLIVWFDEIFSNPPSITSGFKPENLSAPWMDSVLDSINNPNQWGKDGVGVATITKTDAAWEKIAKDWIMKNHPDFSDYTAEDWARLERAHLIAEFDAKTSQGYKLNFLTGEYYR